jgi:predicted nucleic acid-binding protein
VIAPAVLLDTDVASAVYKKRELPILNALLGYEPFISFATSGEMSKWAEVRSWAPHNRAQLRTWLSAAPTIHSSDAVCEVWGTLSADGHLRGRHRPQNDTWVAAVALTHGLPLATLNIRDYADTEANHGLRLIRPRPGESW